MNDRHFLDTNVCLYAFDPNDEKSKTARYLIASRPIISVQVLNELCRIITEKWKLSTETAAENVEFIAARSEVLDLTIDLTTSALKIKNRYRFSWWDSLIVAAAMKSGCSMLYTEDLQHGQIIEDSLLIVNPFIA